jgi:hypothetical protein
MTVKGDAVDLSGIRERSIFADDFSRRALHDSILVTC